MTRGLFVTFEGGEGAGKSTQIRRLATALRAARRPHLVTREPGGSPGAEAVRHVILSGAAQPFGQTMEALLFAAARADHLERRILPALGRGEVVLCDRYVDSSRVYQGVTGGLDPAFMQELEQAAIGDRLPDLTLILDIDPEEGLRRAADRRGADRPDRFEGEDLDLHRRRREAFLQIARDEPRRCVVIDASRDAETVADEVVDVVFAALDRQSAASGAAVR